MIRSIEPERKPRRLRGVDPEEDIRTTAPDWWLNARRDPPPGVFGPWPKDARQ
jgi:hypothetical protein